MYLFTKVETLSICRLVQEPAAQETPRTFGAPKIWQGQVRQLTSLITRSAALRSGMKALQRRVMGPGRFAAEPREHSEHRRVEKGWGTHVLLNSWSRKLQPATTLPCCFPTTPESWLFKNSMRKKQTRTCQEEHHQRTPLCENCNFISAHQCCYLQPKKLPKNVASFFISFYSQSVFITWGNSPICFHST